MTGIWPSGNSTSTAGPATWITLPSVMMFLLAGLSPRCRLKPAPQLLQSGGAADDLDNLAGDAGLADAVHIQRQPVDHIRGVVGGRIHRRHARGMLRRGRLQQRAIKL